MMRGTPGMRIVFGILSPVFLLLCVVAIRSEEARPWVPYQEEFARMLVERARTKLQEAPAGDAEKEAARWQRVIDEASNWTPEIKQIYLEDINVADRCTTCHLGVDNPLFADAPEPYRTHPGTVLASHEVNRFGCTPCHDGQGLATAVEAAHGQESNWERPMLPAAMLQTACARCHEVTHGLAEAEGVTQGADLFMAKGCYGCHDIKGISYLPKFGPPLTDVKSKLTDPSRWVQAWLTEPSKLAPDTLMPNFHVDEEQIGQITAFLLTLGQPTRQEPLVLGDASAEQGKKLFTERGCRGCHAVEPDEHSVSPRVPHLGMVGSKVTPEWLDRWLTDPRKYNPDTAMPKLEVTDEERLALVAYLLTLKRTEPLLHEPDVSRFDTAAGKELVKHFECYGCHAIDGFETVRPSVPDLGDFARKPLDEIDFGTVPDLRRTKWDWLRHKLREPRAFESAKIKLKMPTGPLADEEMDPLIAFVLGMDGRPLSPSHLAPATPAQQARRNLSWMITRLNCTGCHPLDAKDPHIAQFFERKTRVAPTLDGAGARLQGQYMYDFVLEPKSVRPWLTMRMPTFGFTEPQARTVVDGFAAIADVSNPYTYVARINFVQEDFDRGFRRFRHYKCIQCHPSSIEGGLPEDLDPDDLSINLMLSKERLRPQWFADFLERPKQIAGTQTRMPTVFYTVDGVPKVERPQDDIRDIVTYVMSMTESPEDSLQAYEQTLEAEKAKDEIDWTTIQY